MNDTCVARAVHRVMVSGRVRVQLLRENWETSWSPCAIPGRVDRTAASPKHGGVDDVLFRGLRAAGYLRRTRPRLGDCALWSCKSGYNVQGGLLGALGRVFASWMVLLRCAILCLSVTPFLRSKIGARQIKVDGIGILGEVVACLESASARSSSAASLTGPLELFWTELVRRPSDGCRHVSAKLGHEVAVGQH